MMAKKMAGGETKSQEILSRSAKYNRVEREADELGRVIGVRRLRPSEQLRIEEMSQGLDGTSKMTGEDGVEMDVPRRAPLIMAAMVCEIDGNPVSFAKSRAELDAVLNRLDEEGLAAVAKALARLTADETQKDTVEDAKNL